MTPKTTKSSDKPTNRAQLERSFGGSVSWAGRLQPDRFRCKEVQTARGEHRNPSGIDAKYGDHFLQADLSMPIRFSNLDYFPASRQAGTIRLCDGEHWCLPALQCIGIGSAQNLIAVRRRRERV